MEQNYLKVAENNAKKVSTNSTFPLQQLDGLQSISHSQVEKNTYSFLSK